jgi:hypothetical protein
MHREVNEMGDWKLEGKSERHNKQGKSDCALCIPLPPPRANKWS